MKRKIYLYGELAEKYGKCFELAVQSIAEAVKALNANFPDFYQTIRNERYHILKGSDLKSCEEITEKELRVLFPSGDFHIMPAVEGGKSQWLNIVIGVVLIAASWYIGGAGGWGWFAAGGIKAGIATGILGMGVSMALGGISGLLTPVPKASAYGDRESPEQRSSFIFDGPTNRIEQGGPIPLGFGEFIIGSTVIAGAVDVEQL